MKRDSKRKKAGLSGIVVTLILIVISLVAVGAVWMVVNNILNEQSDQASLGTITFSAGITSLSLDNSSNSVAVTVQRNAGEADLKGMNFYFYNGTGVEVRTEYFTMTELAEKTFLFQLAMNISILNNISIAPIFGTADGKEILGNIADSYNIGKRVYAEIPIGNNSTCVPTTCSALGYNCGTWLNGTCSGTLNCGNCSVGVCITGTCSSTISELLPSERKINWSQVGIPGGIPSRTTICANVRNAPYNAVGDGVHDDLLAIQSAIDACPVNQVVYIPNGRYLVTSDIIINKSIVLRGESPKDTKIIFNTTVDNAADNIITMKTGKSKLGASINVISGYTKNSTQLVLVNASSISVGDYIIISQLNNAITTSVGTNGRYCDWCGTENGTRNMQQVTKVTAKNGNTITIKEPFDITFEASLNPYIKEVSNVLEWAGLEQLNLERTPAAGVTTGGWAVRASYCSYCWIKNISTNMTLRGHVRLEFSYSSVVRDSYFFNGYSHESGNSYGIALYQMNSNHLIENNIVRKARHALIFAGGGSGNVLGYNYLLEGDMDNINWLAQDSETHGSHPYMNLFEGNVYGKVDHGDTWGSSSDNTHFREYSSRLFNNSEKSGGSWAVQIGTKNHYENFIGNILCHPGCTGQYMPSDFTGGVKAVYRIGFQDDGDQIQSVAPETLGTILHGNFDYLTNSVIWDPAISQHNLPSSMYLSSKPSWFGSVSWPPIGPDISGYVNEIPAQIRYSNMD